MKISRRKILISGLAFGGILTGSNLASWSGQEIDKNLSFFVPATGERETITYWSGGVYLTDGVAAVNRILRDYKTDIIGSISVKLLDILHSMLMSSDNYKEIEVVRGHIAVEANRVPFITDSPDAFHNAGRAIDIRAQGVDLGHLVEDFVRWFEGGIGIYPKKKFVHLDLGPSRRWIG